MKDMLYVLDKVATWTLVCGVLVLFTSCVEQKKTTTKVGVLSSTVENEIKVIPAAENVAEYYHLLKDKRVGMVVNQTSVVGNRHLVDTLLDLKVNVTTIFAPEHGFRGLADAGEEINDGTDPRTGLPLVSLYGKNKKPRPKDLSNLDVMVFDIQDVGVRFYTYISTLHYVMEACAEQGIPIIVLDRPNPNAHYVDGPVLEEKFTSFVGMHPVPVVYGMTIGEYAQMINGEGWLDNGVQVELTVIQNRNYTHDTYYEPPIKPSPNLPNIQSVLLYPSLCFFEGTHISVGRGTHTQFQVYGHPKIAYASYAFKPVSMPGAKYPKHENQLCYGFPLMQQTKGALYDRKQLNLQYLLNAYQALNSIEEDFFLDNNFFEKLAGTAALRQQIIAGLSEEEIRKSWQHDLESFMQVRSKYLIYE